VEGLREKKGVRKSKMFRYRRPSGRQDNFCITPGPASKRFKLADRAENRTSEGGEKRGGTMEWRWKSGGEMTTFLITKRHTGGE